MKRNPLKFIETIQGYMKQVKKKEENTYKPAPTLKKEKAPLGITIMSIQHELYKRFVSMFYADKSLFRSKTKTLSKLAFQGAIVAQVT